MTIPNIAGRMAAFPNIERGVRRDRPPSAPILVNPKQRELFVEESNKESWQAAPQDYRVR